MTSNCSVAESRRLQKASPCPGLFRIVQSKDGGICRIKLPQGRISAPQVRVIADASAQWGNGQVEMTNRANFQIRGVAVANEEVLIQTLLDAGLGPKDAGADDIRNVMVSASLGRDPHALTDTTALAADVLALLEGDARYHALSPKFSILLDGGEADCAVDHPHDMWFSAMNESMFAFGFAGHPPFTAQDQPMMGMIGKAHLVDLVRAALDVFLEISGQNPKITRFRHMADQADLPERLMARQHFSQVGMVWERAIPNRMAHLGVRAQRQAGQVMIGAVPPLGRATPDVLHRLADITEQANGGTLRLTPWSGFLLADVPQANAAAIVAALQDAGFVVGAADPMAQMVACAGTLGCNSALAATKHDAVTLATLLRAPRDVHLTACPKSCASARVAEFTLVATDPASYNLFRRDQVGQSGFGTPIGRNVTLAQAAELMA